jgi:hypothetical protein
MALKVAYTTLNGLRRPTAFADASVIPNDFRIVPVMGPALRPAPGGRLVMYTRQLYKRWLEDELGQGEGSQKQDG